MSTQDNKNVVRSLIKAIEAGDLNKMGLITTDNATFWVSPTTISSGSHTKQEWLQMMSGAFSELLGR